jgi:hypothetical protein
MQRYLVNLIWVLLLYENLWKIKLSLWLWCFVRTLRYEDHSRGFQGYVPVLRRQTNCNPS